MKIFLACLYFFIFSLCLSAQVETDTIDLSMVEVSSKPLFENDESKNHYAWLEKKMLKTYPVFSALYLDYQNVVSKFDTIQNKRSQRKIKKKETKEFINRHFNSLKRLTNKEGKLLCKLIHRESNKTALEIIKEFKGGFYSSFASLQAKFVDIDLKQVFNKEEVREDKYIENILKKLFRKKLLIDVKSVAPTKN